MNVQVWYLKQEKLANYIERCDAQWPEEFDMVRDSLHGPVLGEKDMLEVCEWEFDSLNGSPEYPPGWDKRSMSVGDVVSFVEAETAYRCMPSGWERI